MMMKDQKHLRDPGRTKVGKNKEECQDSSKYQCYMMMPALGGAEIARSSNRLSIRN